MNPKKTYIEVVLPLPVEGSFTYSVPNKFQEVAKGQRVVVQFGVRKIYTAIILDIHNKKPELYQAKDIIAVLDESNVVNEKQLRFWKWISLYYMSKLGDVMNVALPSSLKLASESKIIVHPNFDGDMGELSDKEHSIIISLTLKEKLTVSEVIDLTNTTSVFPIINELIRKEVVQIEEELHDSFKKKSLLFVDLVGEEFDSYSEKVKNAKKQEDLLQYFVQYKTQYPKKKWTVSEVLKKTNISRGVLNALVTKGILKLEKSEVSRLLPSSDNIEEIKK